MPIARVCVVSFACAAIALACTASVDAQVLTRHAVSIEMAKTMANVAQDTCAELGYSVSVHVVDTAGNTLVAYRGEESGVHTFVNSFRKAYSAMTFRRPSSTFGERWENGEVGAPVAIDAAGHGRAARRFSDSCRRRGDRRYRCVRRGNGRGCDLCARWNRSRLRRASVAVVRRWTVRCEACRAIIAARA